MSPVPFIMSLCSGRTYLRCLFRTPLMLRQDRKDTRIFCGITMVTTVLTCLSFCLFNGFIWPTEYVVVNEILLSGYLESIQTE
jgi:hypothetical protein